MALPKLLSQIGKADWKSIVVSLCLIAPTITIRIAIMKNMPLICLEKC